MVGQQLNHFLPAMPETSGRLPKGKNDLLSPLRHLQDGLIVLRSYGIF